jgi:hypothetical protein
MNINETPIHRRPTSCHVCGSANDHGARRSDQGHDFWSNAEAASYFAAEDRGRTFAYSSGETTVEGQFVATTRGR